MGILPVRPEMALRVSLTKRSYRGIRKAYVLMEEARAKKPRVDHILRMMRCVAFQEAALNRKFWRGRE